MRYLVFLPFIILCFNGCFLPGKDCFKDHRFTIDFNIFPAQDTFHVGDTIWISSTIPEELLDEENQEMLDVSDIKFPIIFAAGQVDTLDFAPAEYYFDYVVEQGDLHFEYVATWIDVYLQYENIDKQQQIRFGIIPKRTAIIKILFDAKTEEVEAIHPSDCVGATSLYYKTNGGDGEANNYYFIEESNNPWVQVTIDEYNMIGTYTFAVIE